MGVMKSPRKLGGPTVVMVPLWILTAVFLLAATAVRAQEARWRELSKEAEALIWAGKGDAAEAKLTEATQLAEQALGPDHPDVAVPLFRMAHLLEVRVRVDEAEPLYQRAFTILEKALGAEHARTVSAMYALAEILDRQRKYALAEPLYERTLANWEKTPPRSAAGEGGVLLLTAEDRVRALLGQLARLYEVQAKYAQAEPLRERILKIEERRLGMNNSSLVYPLMNLAGNYVDQAKYAQAEPLYRRLLAIDESYYGRDNINLVTPLNALAMLYSRQGRYGEAEALLYRVLRLREKTQGAQHPAISAALESIASLFVAQARYADAEPLYFRALKISEKAMKKPEPAEWDHRQLANCLEKLAALYRKTDREAKAQAFEKRAATIRSEIPPEPLLSLPKNWGQRHP